MSPAIVFAQYILLTSVGMLAANRLGGSFSLVAVVFAIFGVIYNVRPIRAKDRAFLDVIVESLNNPLRFLFGWFAVTPHVAPPVSILLAYWFGGAFLMAAKRVSEHRAIVEAGGTASLAAYRPSFAVYTQSSLVTSCLVYAQGFAFMMAIFLLKYRIEYLVVIPLLIALFAAYMRLALTPDSAAARPEELMRQPAMMIGAAVTMALFGVLTFVDLPWLNGLTSSDLIRLGLGR
jgi:4-hydroxybenzoate polyprenyltransferase